jgi:hypothetical protein
MYLFKEVFMRFIQAVVLCSVVILAAGCATVSAPKPHGGKPQVPSAGMQACHQITTGMMDFIDYSSQPQHAEDEVSFHKFSKLMTLYAQRSQVCKDALAPHPYNVSNYTIAMIEELKAIGFSQGMKFKEWAALSRRVYEQHFTKPSAESCTYITRYVFGQGVPNAAGVKELLKDKANQQRWRKFWNKEFLNRVCGIKQPASASGRHQEMLYASPEI